MAEISGKKVIPIELEMISQRFDLVRFNKQDNHKYPPEYYFKIYTACLLHLNCKAAYVGVKNIYI